MADSVNLVVSMITNTGSSNREWGLSPFDERNDCSTETHEEWGNI